MRKTSNRLADGREIIYFDADGAVERTAQDTRPLSPIDVSTELRYDRITGTWVTYASHRQDRSYLPAAQDCPLCPSTKDHPTEIPEADYQVVAFENRFPSLAAPPPGTASAGPMTPQAYVIGPPGTADGGDEDLLPHRPGAGRCEVVCYTSDHNASFADLEPGRVDLVLDALVDRTTELGAIDQVEQVFCFENRGREIGVTQPHPHGQIYAYPFIPPRTERALAAASTHRRRWDSNLYDDVLAAERSDGTRVVMSTGHWTALVPYAARWPYELHCYPSQRAPDLAGLSAPARAELPEVLHDVFSRFARLFDEPAPYISGWHQAPTAVGRDDWAVHLELFTIRRANDKLKYLAGSESGMEAFANDIVPEVAAERLRQVKI